MLINILLGFVAVIFLIALISMKINKKSYLVMLLILIMPFIFNYRYLFRTEESFVGINKMVFLVLSICIFLISLVILSRSKSLKLNPLLVLNFGILMYILNESVLQVGNSLTLLGDDLKMYNRVEFIKISLLLLIQIESFFMMRNKKRGKSAKN